MTEEREPPGREPGTPPGPGEAAPPPVPPPPPAPEPAREPPLRRRLTRSRRDRMIGGVAGGLAEYMGVDSALVRILIVVFTLLTGGLVILLYIAAWIVMPEAREDEERQEAAPARGDGQLAALVLGLVLILIGVWALLRALDIPAPPWDLILSILLILTGIAIAVWSRGGLHGGLFFVALILTGVLALSTTADVTFDWESGFGDRRVEPVTFEAVESSYSHAFGSMTVDLTEVDWPEGTHQLDLSIAFGEMQVLIPSGVEFRVNASTAFGETRAARRSSAGIVSDMDYETPGYDQSQRRLDLNVSTAFGNTEVRHQ